MANRLFTLSAALIAAAILTACGESPSAPSDECASLPTAPRSARVDLGRPSFSNPTVVTNPLYPMSVLARAILMGTSDGEPFRSETTLLPSTRIIRVDGRDVEVLQSQYVAWVGRRIHEVAIDWYAQDDAGAVWYLGEDVFNFANGVIEDTDGTWLADREGPAAMIMPANPQIGDVWRPENACEVVFEEVEVDEIGVTVAGPRGAVTGAIVTTELHMDGTYESKIFAPGYGEFSTGSGANLEALALAVPTDAVVGAMPAELGTLSAGARRIFEAAALARWDTAATRFAGMSAAWNAFQAGTVPPLLRTRMVAAIAALDAAVQAQDAVASRQASIDLDLASLDLQLRHRTVTQVDFDLLDLWARQLQVDADASDPAGVLADAATLMWIRSRLAADVVAGAEFRQVQAALVSVRESAFRRDLGAVIEASEALRRSLRRPN